MKNSILKLLSESTEDYISGEGISRELGISRAAVWKYINILKDEGYIIESSTKKGYKLLSAPDILTLEEVKPYLKTKFIGNNILHFNTITSTNLKAKEIYSEDMPDGTVIVSEEQSSGRGRLGRSWVSPYAKGIWMSIILKPDIEPMEAYKTTLISAAAVYKALADQNVNSWIKWPNDIILNNKKVCGILTEMNAELNKIHYLVIGIGLNINSDSDDIPEDIANKATSLKIEYNKFFNRKLLMAGILNHFEPLYEEFIHTRSIASSIEICKTQSAVLNRDIYIIEGDKNTLVHAIDLSSDGHLIVKIGSETKEVFSGEVSIRALDGYI